MHAQIPVQCMYFMHSQKPEEKFEGWSMTQVEVKYECKWSMSHFGASEDSYTD